MRKWIRILRGGDPDPSVRKRFAGLSPAHIYTVWGLSFGVLLLTLGMGTRWAVVHPTLVPAGEANLETLLTVTALYVLPVFPFALVLAWIRFAPLSRHTQLRGRGIIVVWSGFALLSAWGVEMMRDLDPCPVWACVGRNRYDARHFQWIWSAYCITAVVLTGKWWKVKEWRLRIVIEPKEQEHSDG